MNVLCDLYVLLCCCFLQQSVLLMVGLVVGFCLFDVLVVGKDGVVGEFEFNVWVCVLVDNIVKIVVYKYDFGIGM